MKTTKISDSNYLKRYLITGHFCGKIVTKIVYQNNISAAIVRFCVENNIPDDQVFTANQYGS